MIKAVNNISNIKIQDYLLRQKHYPSNLLTDDLLFGKLQAYKYFVN